MLAAVLALGCGKTSHADLDKWMDTEKGPAKLKDALADASLDADLSAHAAENLLIIHEEDAVVPAFEKLSPARRVAVLTKLAPRLWKLARVEGELTVANDQQSAAKDLLFAVRDQGDPATRATIDGYVTEWFTGGYYEDRAGRGRISGEVALRAVGAAAAPAIIRAANAVISSPANADGSRVRIGDALLLGLAVTGDPAAVELVLKIVHLDRGDPSLAERAVAALFHAYVEPPGDLFAKTDPGGLTPNLPALSLLARDTDRSNRMLNDVFDLIEAAGPPGCIETLAPLIAKPESPRYLWVAASRALTCGKVGAIAPVIAAMPESGEYEHLALEGAIVGEIAKLEPRDQVITAARTLVASASPVGRWVGIEVLAAVKSKEDAGLIAGLTKDTAVLQGYWGDEPGHGRMTLGKRAAELAKTLQ